MHSTRAFSSPIQLAFNSRSTRAFNSRIQLALAHSAASRGVLMRASTLVKWKIAISRWVQPNRLLVLWFLEPTREWGTAPIDTFSTDVKTAVLSGNLSAFKMSA